MFFKDIIGHEVLKQRITQIVDSGRIPHAQLYTGGSGVGKLALAIATAQYICCEHKSGGEPCGVCPSCAQFEKLSHPDLHFVFPIAKNKENGIVVCDDLVSEFRTCVLQNPYMTLEEWSECMADGKTLQIYSEEGDEIIKKLSFKPYQGKYKVMIIWAPEKMNVTCSNRLLKLLEEPPLDTIFMLVSDNPNDILGTIFSRCQRISVPPINSTDIEKALKARYDLTDSQQRYLVKNAMGSWGKMQSLLRQTESSNMDFEMFVKMMRLAWLLDVKSIKAWTEQMASLPREAQLRFLQNAQRLIRENFVLRLGIEQLNYMSEEERAFAAKFGQFMHERNIVQIMEELSLAEAQIQQNGNTKIILFHLEVILYKLLKKPRIVG